MNAWAVGGTPSRSAPCVDGIRVGLLEPTRLVEAVQVIVAAHAGSPAAATERFRPGRLYQVIGHRDPDAWGWGPGSGQPLFFAAIDRAGDLAGVVGVAPAWCSGVGYELGYLAVLPERRRRGVGLRLVARAVHAARGALGGAPGGFMVARAATPALFERAGWRRVSGTDGDAPAVMLVDL